VKRQITLADLTYEDLNQFPVWKQTPIIAAGGNPVLEPLIKKGQLVPGDVGMVWCLCVCIFKDGSRYLACALCRGDVAEGPICWSVWNGQKEVILLVPPAPENVLRIDGPENFAKSFSRTINQVFPLEIQVCSEFETPPKRRRVRVDATGVLAEDNQ
jgi:hypothetical protein